MDMLTQNDLKQIGELFDEKIDGKFDVFEKKMDEKFEASEKRVVGAMVEQVGEMIEQNLFPKFDTLEAKIAGIEGSIAALPDKDYVDKKIGGLGGNFNLVRRNAGI